MLRAKQIFFIVLIVATWCSAGVQFRVEPIWSKLPQHTSGRLLVSVKKVARSDEQIRLPFDADYIIGLDANDLKEGDSIDVNEHGQCYPPMTGELPAGRYVAAAMLDWHRDDSNCWREPGNVYSPVTPFTVTGTDQTIHLPLAYKVEERKYPTTQGSQLLEIRSARLSEFYRRDIVMRAAVFFPATFDPSRKYPAIYRIPGSGGDGISMLDHPQDAYVHGGASDEVAEAAFVIWLDPESGNGHTLFVNSDNNGPRGDALVRELIPALEAKYPLVAGSGGRIVTGHSSGGWAALWLTLQYPDVFGACFSLSPDPVDFHCLELIDIYGMKNAYSDGTREFPGSRTPDARTVRQENAREEVLGPRNTSAQDWDAWQACWGRRDSSGHVASLFDPITGAIDRDEVEAWRRYDITDLLRRNPDRYAPIFHQKIRLIVGDQDTFFLNNAVAKLEEELDRHPSNDTTGYIRILPAYDHGSITNAPEVRAWSQEMLDWLRTSKSKG